MNFINLSVTLSALKSLLCGPFLEFICCLTSVCFVLLVKKHSNTDYDSTDWSLDGC